ncbi:MAG: Cna B-type domain-containing protein [Lachnospiraceae bacterium]|nr:Cna B-type domain-containing protein [Lachnospiraceae bacterium]
MSGYNLNWTQDGAGTPGFTITDLPALEAGQKYVVDYKADVSGIVPGQDGKLANNASAVSGNHQSWSWNSVSWEKDLKKTGTYDKTTGKISWRITVNPSGKDISGWKIEDTLRYPLYGQYTVWNEAKTYEASGGQTGDNNLSFTFPQDLKDNQKKAKYYIDYWTDAPADNSDVSNTAKVTEKDGTTVTDTGVAPVEHRTFDVTKNFSQETQTESDPYKLTWNAAVTTPDTALGTFTYTDTIENAVNSEGKDQGADSHYGIASEIDAALTEHLKLMVDNYSWYEYRGAGKKTYWHSYYEKERGYTDNVSITVTYYDAGGNVIESTDAASHVKSFRVTVTPKEGVSVLAQKLTLDNYPTYLNTKDAAEGATWTVKNKGETGDHSSEASHDHTKPKTFEKMVSSGRGVAHSYSSGNVQVAYEDVEGILNYRLMLNTKKADEGTITITDHIPAGETYVDGSGYAKFYKDDYNLFDSNYYNGFTFSPGKNPAFHAVTNQDGSTDLTITIQGYKYSSDYPMVAVYYQASVAEDSHWQNAAAPGKTYSNTATWGNHTSTQNTTVTRQVKELDKQGVQLDKKGKPLEIGADGNPVSESNPSGTIRYDIAINPAAKDLDPNSDNLTLVDFLSSNAAAFHPALDLNKVKLYSYDGTTEDHKGSLIDQNRYKIMYDQTSLKMTLVLPDELGAVLEYEYVLDGDFADKFQLDNTATLNGTWKSENKTALRDTSSSATVKTKKVVIYKVDSSDYKKILPGTKFKLDYWDSSANEWKVKKSELTVDDSGTIVFDIVGKELDLSTIYRLKETEALEGYRNGTDAPDVVRYFVVMPEKGSDGKTATKDTTYSEMGGSNTFENGAKVSKSDVTFFQNSGGVMYVPNEYRAIRVQKVWLNADNTDLTDPGKTAEVTLHQTTKKLKTCTITYHLVETNEAVAPGSREKYITADVPLGSVVTAKFTGYNGQINLTYDNVELNNQSPEGVVLSLGTADSDQRVELSGYSYNQWWNWVSHINIETTNTIDEDAKQYEETDNTYDEATLSRNGGWSKVWTDLPKKDASGTTYYYYVTEKTVDGFEAPVYTNNDGIENGTITVTNKKKETNGYVLPSTGGGGTFRIAGLGLALMAVSSFGILQRKRRRRGG